MWTKLLLIIVYSLFEGNMIAPALAGPSNESYCSKLDGYFLMNTTIPGLKGHLRPVIVEGDNERQVRVFGGGGAARAAAALLYVIIRYGLRYEAELIAQDADLCNLSSLAHKWTETVVVAPLSLMPTTGCKIEDNYMGRISGLTKSAVTSDLLLFMYLAPAKRNICATKASSWTFYANLNETKECAFAQPDTIRFQNQSCGDCVVLLARNASINDITVAQEYQKRLSTEYLKLFFYSDLNLRHEMGELTKRNISFLFIYEDLWSDVEGIYHIQAPPCNTSTEICYNNISMSTFRLGDGFSFSYYAPEILYVVKDFAPNTTTLRQILEREETHLSIEEAACSWASNISANDEIKSWFINNNQIVYEIFIGLCDEDYGALNVPLYFINDYMNKSKIFNLNFIIYRDTKFNCNSMTPLIDTLKMVSSRKHVIGYVIGGWNEKTISAVDAAKNSNLLLVFADPVTTEVKLESTMCRSVSGNLLDLAYAYHNFFQKSKWNRIAIISEESDYAKSFSEALFFNINFIWHEITTKPQNIHATLREYQKMDARIFVVNAKWSLAKQILCIALQLNMTSNKYAWITREGHILRCDENKTVDDFHHFSIGLEWRGGMLLPKNSSILERKKWLRLFNSTETSTDKFVLPSNIFLISNAITRLVISFTKFLSNYPIRRYIIQSPESAKLLSTIFDTTASTLSNGPTVFIDEWFGDKLRSVAVWQVQNETVIDLMPPNKTIFKNNNQISDGPYCKISSGGPFERRCHDIPVFLAVLAFILLIVLFMVARRRRLARLARRDLFLLGTLLEHRKHVASTLDTYLIDRHLVKLSHEIGSGCFGRVHFAELKRPGCDAVVVAAKEPHEGIALEEEREFLHEACILAPLSHDHVIRLIGICLKDGPPMVLMEHALHLDLQRYLIERRHLALKATTATPIGNTFDDVSDESLTRLVRQAAAALDYLAERRLVHRDVRAANCLVDKERSLKLADFGMARQLSGSEPEYATRRRALFPVLWMAPESLEQGIFSPASDIWALGVLILEVVTLGARPFGSWPPARVLRHVALGGYAPLPPDTSIYTRNLVTACWRRDPESRPTASEVQHYLKQNSQALSAALLAANPSTDN